MKKLTNKEFIERSKKIHFNKYDYSLVKYTKSKIKVKIICPIHGIFEQTPTKHLIGCGCKFCSGKIKFTTDIFIKKSKKIHKNKYNYSLVNYINISKKVKIICSKHGVFEQSPYSHLQSCGCIKCAGTQKSNTIIFTLKSKKIHKNKYDYSLVNYKNNYTKVKIICPKHGIFEQAPNNHLIGHGCHECGNSKKLTTKKFIEKAKKIHFNKYDYSLVKYKNYKTKIKIVCSKHGIFEQTPDNHISKNQNCPKCNISSKGEYTISKLLENNNIIFETQKTFDDCKNINKLPFDFYLPDHNLCIEYDGRQHFNINTIYYTENIKINDNIKTEYCSNNNINLLRIPYTDDIDEKIKNII